jgi:predicted transcriptional regulator
LRLLLTLAERLAWDMRLIPDITQEKTEIEDETDPQFAGKSYDELLEILLERRMREETTLAEVVHERLWNFVNKLKEKRENG